MDAVVIALVVWLIVAGLVLSLTMMRKQSDARYERMKKEREQR